MVERLVESCERHGRPLVGTCSALRAFDLLELNAETARESVAAQLAEAGLLPDEARALASEWVTAGDFLLTPHDEQAFDFVLGNPPYIRLENVPADRNAAYRQVCPTMRGRSDVFTGFIEMGLRLLRPDGALGFIVADRWMRNQYGAALRSFVAEQFSVEAVVEMHDVDAFEEEVSAYPAVTVIRRRAQGCPLVASTTQAFGEVQADRLKTWASKPRAMPLALESVHASRLPGWFSGRESWPSAAPEQLGVLADLERRFPPLADPTTGTRVGIGPATEADDVFLTRDASIVEPDRLLQIVMAKDLAGGRIAWAGTYLVNPWDDDGLVDIEQWPAFRAHLARHGDRVKSRHTAAKAPFALVEDDRPDDSGLARNSQARPSRNEGIGTPGLDEGQYYPHPNLYYVTSTEWDLEVLGGLMLSEVANLFVGAYCVKMRGGTYRFQAQYLRRIRVPLPGSLKASERRQLAMAFGRRDVEAATAVAARIYGVDASRLATSTRTEVA